MSKTYDVAVIGGGIAGLIAAIDLAKANKSVALLEKSKQIGGRAITVNKNGARFNLGGHALYRSGEAYAMLRELGLKLEGGVPRTDGFAIWRNELVPLPGDALRLLASRLLSWSGKMELAKLLQKLGKIDTQALGNTTLREWAEREIRDPMARHLVYALCRTATYAHDIDYQLSGPVVRQVHRSLKSGVQYIHGGWQTIVDQLRELAERAGVDVLSGKNVAAIAHEDGRVRGVRFADGETMAVAHVIAATPPAVTFGMVSGAERTALRRWKEEARPSMAACLDLALKRLPAPNRHVAIGLDRPVFFTHHSRVATLSDNGTMVVHLIKYNGTGASDPQADEALLEQTMSLLHPDWQREVATRQYLPNIAVVHDYAHVGRTGPQRGPAVPEIAGLYVAGDWASHGEMLLDAAAASARRASRQALLELTRGGGASRSAIAIG